jgi:hypothetical protein
LSNFMNEPIMERWERTIQETAAMLVYPPTPDIAGRVRSRLASQREASSRQWTVSGQRSAVSRRQLAWVAALVLALLVGSLLFVPELRAALLRVLQIGPIRVFVDETLPEPTTVPTATPLASPTAEPLDVAMTRPPAATASLSPTPTSPPHSLALSQLGEPVTLAEAQEAVSFSIVQPDYPEGIGAPDAAYLHTSGNVTAVTLVWSQPENPDRIWFTLTQIPLSEFEFALKWAREEDVREFFLNGQRAIWIQGPHRIQLVNPEIVSTIRMASNVLIWTAGDTTYRIEGDLVLDEATRIAESLPPD